MKNTKILLILEKQIDKIVLAVFALISLFLLWVYVVGNPYSEKVSIQERQKKLSPSEIDRYVKQEAEKMVAELDKPAPPIPPREPYVLNFNQLLQCPIADVSSSVQIPYPGAGDTVIEEDRLYALPQIPGLTDVEVFGLRGAAKVPTEEVTPARPYANAMGEVRDIDLVSVSARFDVKKLYMNFQQSFNGPRLKSSWKDPALATPVFANLELQRRTMQKDGQWGPWEFVPYTKIDSYQEQRKELPLTLEQSQFEVNLLMPLYKDNDVQREILQPKGYTFSVSRMDWLPPTFLKEALEIQDKEDEMLERQRREERLKTQTGSTRPTQTKRQPAARGTRGRNQPEVVPDMTVEGVYGATAGKTGSKQRTVDEVKKDFAKVLLDDRSDVWSQQDLLVWVHDDTVEPGSTCQYRMRVGVFNPIAGKDWFQQDQVQYQNQMVLWSDYSEPTEVLSVPRMIYVFPMDTIANQAVPNKIDGVKVEVAKYYLGRWRNFDFDVYQGETIGYEVEDDSSAGNAGTLAGINAEQMAMYQVMGGDQSQALSRKVDFSTGITFVDVAEETVWKSSLRQSILYKMLYAEADALQQMPIGKSNWSLDIRDTYAEIEKDMKRNVQQHGMTMPSEMTVPPMVPPMILPPK